MNNIKKLSGKIDEEGISAKEYYEYTLKKKYKHTKAIVRKLHNLKINLDKGPVLDVGTGAGVLARELRKVVPANIPIIGIDIDFNMLKYARKVNTQNAKMMLFLQNSDSVLPFKRESFQIIISEDSLHHFINIKDMLKELVNALKNGGTMILIDINKKSIWTKILQVYFKIKIKLNIIRKEEMANYISILNSYDIRHLDALFHEITSNKYEFINFKSCFIFKMEKHNV
jgi:ubiquinone/menaquinone biosynthesis C-methylase UbiE